MSKKSLTVYEGKLNWNPELEYYISNVEINELSNELNEMLLDEIHIKITNKADDKVLFDKQGILHRRNDLGKSIYRLFIDDFCLDEILFSLADREFNNTRIEFIKTKELKYKNTLDLEVA